ncbi:MAG: hypothetical protein V4515_00715 [Chloroflexota bacterium]
MTNVPGHPVSPEQIRRGRSLTFPGTLTTLVIGAALFAMVIAPQPRAGAPGAVPSPVPDASPVPSTSGATPAESGPSASPVVPPAGRAAMDALAWTVKDPATGGWLVGIGSAPASSLAIGDGWAKADWGHVAVLRRSGGDTLVGAAGPADGWTVHAYAVPFSERTGKARVDREGRYVFIHGGGDGQDEGIAALDVRTGEFHQIVAPGPLAAGYERNYLLWSPSGQTLASTICDMEGCIVDIVDAGSLTARRITEPFPAVAISDQLAIGRTRTGAPWQVLDLASGAVHASSLDPKIEPSVILMTGETTVVLDTEDADGYRILVVDLATDAITVLYDEPATPKPALRLFAMASGDAGSILLASDRSIADALSSGSGLPQIHRLDARTGDVSPLAVRLGG